MHATREGFAAIAAELSRGATDDHLRRAVAAVEELESRHFGALDSMLRGFGPVARERAAELFERDVRPIRTELSRALNDLGRRENERFHEARDHARRSTVRAVRLLLGVAGLSLVAAIALMFAVARVLLLLARSRADLQRSHDRLAHTNHELDAFAGRIAHDLRNVLAPLPLTAARLKRAADLAAIGDAASRLDRLGRRSERLIEALLAFSRGGVQLDAHAVAPVAAAIHEAAEDLASLACDVDATIEIDVQDATVRCSPALLHTVLVNLLGNALKFVSGRPVREVTVSARVATSRCRIAISDTGPGIPPEWRTRIFSPFVRVPGTAAPGSGIGLATVHRIVRAHGGDIEVQPGTASGTTIVFELPVVEVSATARAPGVS